MVSHSDDSTLHLPRIMALHGGGTNARIFRMQCRVLERALSPYFRLVFAEALFPTEAGSDVTRVYRDHGPFKAWLRIRSDDPFLDAHHAVHQIDASITAAQHKDNQFGATGKWVGLIGFSQGAKLAASIIYSQQCLQRQGVNINGSGYQFALLLAGRGPLVWLPSDPGRPMPRGLVDAAQATTSTRGLYESLVRGDNVEHLLRVPTIHVHGLKDPGLQLHRELLCRYCDLKTTRLLEWDGIHRVPIRSQDVNAIVEQVLSVAREVGVLS